LKFFVFTFAMPIAQIIFFLQFETVYTCVTYLYLPYNMYRVNDEIFTSILTLWRGQMFVIYLYQVFELKKHIYLYLNDMYLKNLCPTLLDCYIKINMHVQHLENLNFFIRKKGLRLMNYFLPKINSL
jgi:hypothetical protein